jgi:hypothetical protein
MMSLEGPFLAAVIARLADPRFNLAAHGVAFAFALLIEAPVIMLMSASTALVEDVPSFRRLRNFAYVLIGGVTALQLFVLIPPVFRFLMLDLIAVPEEVATLTYGALWLLLPWPGAIGYRRLYQGILIRDGLTRLVAYGTVVRLSTMAGTGLLLFFFFGPPGAYVGAAGLSVGVLAEAIASRIMVHGSLKRLPRGAEDGARSGDPEGGDPLGEEPVRATRSTGEGTLTYGRIVSFYYPLALTSLIGLAAQPMMTFFMGRATAPVESLAVFPVVAALTFIFRSMGLSYQEVVITLMGRDNRSFKALARFGFILGLCASGGLALVALTPLSGIWFESVSGLRPELAQFALLPTAILAPLPFLSVVLSFQRGLLVGARTTRPITVATALEVGGIAVVFPILGWNWGWVGVTAAAVAILMGRVAANTFLIGPCRMALKRTAWQPDSPRV